MNKLMVCFFLIIASLSTQAQITKTLAEEQIKLVMKFQESAWNRGDIPGFMDGYWNSDSLLFIGSKGPTYGYSKTLTNYLKSYPTRDKMGQLTFGFVKIEILSDTQAFVVGTWHLQRKDDDVGGHFTLLWRKLDGEWEIVVDHSS
ncbi:nuclear transport factor 2 family protein [Vicingaceae bacterium]|nr:nuclear transport factor 2 family protein [Vicingaceae bacterium]MDB9964543.1 nuclear transport factor 2 family protein [Vicingaceae bacterium]MDC1451726.1 nuclear transport factor 2 family protein [Vicingaceae bacterium]